MVTQNGLKLRIALISQSKVVATQCNRTCYYRMMRHMEIVHNSYSGALSEDIYFDSTHYKGFVLVAIVTAYFNEYDQSRYCVV